MLFTQKLSGVCFSTKKFQVKSYSGVVWELSILYDSITMLFTQKLAGITPLAIVAIFTRIGYISYQVCDV